MTKTWIYKPNQKLYYFEPDERMVGIYVDAVGGVTISNRNNTGYVTHNLVMKKRGVISGKEFKKIFRSEEIRYVTIVIYSKSDHLLNQVIVLLDAMQLRYSVVSTQTWWKYFERKYDTSLTDITTFILKNMFDVADLVSYRGQIHSGMAYSYLLCLWANKYHTANTTDEVLRRGLGNLTYMPKQKKSKKISQKNKK